MANEGGPCNRFGSAIRSSLSRRGIWRSLPISMAQPSDHPHRDETPAERLVALLERQGLEEGLRAILETIEARKAGEQREARLKLLEYLLEGQPPLTEEEIEQARREWQG